MVGRRGEERERLSKEKDGRRVGGKGEVRI